MLDMFELEQATANLFTTHTHACIDCGQPYQTCNPSPRVGRCSRCIITRIDAPAAVSEARITCRVCGAGASVPLAHPALLCPLCLEDLDQTRDRLATWLGGALERLDTNQAAWDAQRATSDRWPAIQGALIAVAERRATPEALASTWQKRKAEGGAVAALLEAYEGYARTADQIGEELNKIYQAQREINQAFLATEI